MTRAEMLRRFNLACGVLPEREADKPIMSEETPGEFLSHRALNGDILPISVSDDDQIASVTPPQFPWTANNPSSDGPSFYIPPIGGFPGAPGFPGFPTFPPVVPPPPPPPPVAPVPEPESIVLLLTGVIGGVGVIGSRIRASQS